MAPQQIDNFTLTDCDGKICYKWTDEGISRFPQYSENERICKMDDLRFEDGDNSVSKK